MLRVAFHTLGCKVNQYESEALATELERCGFRIVTWEQQAEVYVINGCAVTARAAAKTRQQARQIKRFHPQARLVLIGCYSAAEPVQARESGADLVLDNTEKPFLADHLRALLEQHSVLPHEYAAGFTEYPEGMPREHTRPMVKIQDGCNMHCTYCIIPDLRGPEHSRAPEAVMAEVQAFAAMGYRELVLTGIHLSRWGNDFEPQRRLVELLRELLMLDNLPRLRLSSAEPTDIDDELIALFAKGDSRLCPHLHIPLQSGCDATLQRMGRRYDTEDYRGLVRKLRAKIPEIAISTDLIVGFPGESDDEFAATMDFCREMAFSRMHIFRYSSRSGTKAATMSGKISKAVQEERSRAMHDLAAAMATEYAVNMIGRNVHVLLEQYQSETGSAKGYCEYYLECEASFDGFIPPQGEMVLMKIRHNHGDQLHGEIIAREK